MNIKEINEALSPFWDKYVKEHRIAVKKEEAIQIMEKAEAEGFGIELFEYPNRTIVQIYSKRVEDFGRTNIRLFPEYNEVNMNPGELNSFEEIKELQSLVELIDYISTIVELN